MAVTKSNQEDQEDQGDQEDLQMAISDQPDVKFKESIDYSSRNA